MHSDGDFVGLLCLMFVPVKNVYASFSATIPSVSMRCSDCLLCAVVRLTSMASFMVTSLSGKLFESSMEIICCSTMFTSQVLLFRGKGVDTEKCLS